LAACRQSGKFIIRQFNSMSHDEYSICFSTATQPSLSIKPVARRALTYQYAWRVLTLSPVCACADPGVCWPWRVLALSQTPRAALSRGARPCRIDSDGVLRPAACSSDINWMTAVLPHGGRRDRPSRKTPPPHRHGPEANVVLAPDAARVCRRWRGERTTRSSGAAGESSWPHTTTWRREQTATTITTEQQQPQRAPEELRRLSQPSWPILAGPSLRSSLNCRSGTIRSLTKPLP
jgi:hypothetical protein